MTQRPLGGHEAGTGPGAAVWAWNQEERQEANGRQKGARGGVQLPREAKLLDELVLQLLMSVTLTFGERW